MPTEPSLRTSADESLGYNPLISLRPIEVGFISRSPRRLGSGPLAIAKTAIRIVIAG
jgi:hypothetical protein